MGTGSDGEPVALRGARPIFTAEWQEGLTAGPNSAQPCTFQVFSVAGQTYNPVTDTWTETKTVHYDGPARVQPIRGSRTQRYPGDETPVLSYRVQIPLSTKDFRPGMQGRCTASPLNPTLTKYAFVLREVGNSGNPIETTLEFEVNQETVV